MPPLNMILDELRVGLDERENAIDDGSPAIVDTPTIISTTDLDVEALTGQKRKRADGPVYTDEDDDGTISCDAGISRATAIRIVPPALQYPKSLYFGHEPITAPANESQILEELLNLPITDNDPLDETFIEAELHDYCIYRAHRSRRGRTPDCFNESSTSGELVSLNELNEWNVACFYFDGNLCFDGKQYHVERIPFQLLSLGGYEDLERASIGSDIWIQTGKGQTRGVWYRLGRPAPEYQKYQNYFLWVADFAKHVIDFIYVKTQVRLSDFRQDFYEWLLETYTNDASMTDWLTEYADTDFRRAVSSQAIFLYSQALQIDKRYYKCDLWADVHPRDLTFIPEQIEGPHVPGEALLRDQNGGKVYRRKTTVTPYVYNCFRHLPWAGLLYPQEPDASSPPSPLLSQNEQLPRPHSPDSSINVGDIIAITPDQTSSWRTPDVEWLALVQEIDETTAGGKLSVLWFYRPCDTACMKMTYPHAGEIFLSDHCNCGDSPICVSDVIRKPTVALYGQPGGPEEFFCRQRYREADAAWTTLRPHHLQCSCKSKPMEAQYQKGQTILYQSGRWLKPAIVIGPDADDATRTRIRQLPFRGRDFQEPRAASNEVVFTDRIVSIKTKRIARPCSIRFFPIQEVEDHKIPIPYNRDGAGDFFYFTCAETEDGELKRLESSRLPSFSEGPSSLHDVKKRPLRTLDLFCGGGNFARGLEEAGAVKCEWAVDYYNQAIHTYYANAPDGSKSQMFRGSVNHFLTEALRGTSDDASIPRRGEVEAIIAGSPCQGFSMANPKRGNIPGLLNESLVASVVSFIDFYRPKYVFLENVKGMAMGGEENNALAAVLCAIVSLGYQVQTYFLDAWSFGSSQSRSRIFISCTAQDLSVPSEPQATHSHPPWVRSGGLGRTANGLQTSARHYVPTPFAYVTAEDATQDLPQSDHTLASVRWPDHRSARALTVVNRIRIASIPRYPGGTGFLGACERGYMPSLQVENFSWDNQTRAGGTSKVWTRIRRDRFFPTIQTAPRPDDGQSGNILHWHEHRLLTILEARRAQGFLDTDVILGSVADQWKIIGNSVARPVAFALGLALRKAWLASPSAPTSECSDSSEQTLAERDGTDGVQLTANFTPFSLTAKINDIGE